MHSPQVHPAASTPPPATAAREDASDWHATLDLAFTKERGRTVLKHAHDGPLRVQRPLYPEGARCQVHLLHPPAGIVGGDRLTVNAQVKAGAQAQLLTPGATLVYRSAGFEAKVRLQLDIEDDGCLEYLPHETIHFNGAQSRGQTRIMLSPKSRLIFRETHCFGRPSAREQFTAGYARWRTEIHRDGAPIWFENTVIDAPTWLNTTAGMRGHAYSGTLIATPFDAVDCDALRADISNPDTVLTCVEGLLIARYLGDDGQAWRDISESLWRALRPQVVGSAATAPRIWST